MVGFVRTAAVGQGDNEGLLYRTNRPKLVRFCLL